MNALASIKDQTIREYLNNIDFKEDFSVKQIKRDLHKLLGETPAIELEFKKEEFFSEKLGEKPRVIESVKSILISFSDGDEQMGIPSVQKVTYFV